VAAPVAYLNGLESRRPPHIKKKPQREDLKITPEAIKSKKKEFG
jgi:hypothetical protein